MFCLISVILLAGSEISQKISLTSKINLSAITNNFYVWGLQGIMGILLALVTGQFSLSLSNTSIIKLILVSLVYFIGGTLFYTSYKGNSTSISEILGTLSVVASSFLGVLFLKESWNIYKILGVLLIMTAILILNFNNKERFNKYNLLAMAGGACWGIAYTLDKSLVTNISPFMYLGLMCLGVAFASILFGAKSIIKESKRIKVPDFYHLLTAASFGSAFNLFTFFAYRSGANVGIADAINNTSIFFIILFEIILLKDKTHLPRKIIAGLIAVSGVIMIGLLS